MVTVVTRGVVRTCEVVLGSGTGGGEVDSFGDWVGLVGVFEMVRIVGGSVRSVGSVLDRRWLKWSCYVV